MKRNVTTEGSDHCRRMDISAVNEAESSEGQVAALDWKDHGVTPSRDPNELYDGSSKDCLWDGVGRQRIPKGLSGKRDDDNNDGERDEDGAGNISGGGRDPGGGDGRQLEQRKLTRKLKPLIMITPPKPSLDTLSDVTPKAELSKLQRLEHGQLEYFPIYGNGFRQQPLRTEHHSWPDKINETYEERPKISTQDLQGHFSQIPEAMMLRERWLKSQRWRRFGKNVLKGGMKSVSSARVVLLESVRRVLSR